MPSQCGQDNWVLQQLKNKRNGIFLDVGAGHPIGHSNTERLEREFGWTGLCIEPNPTFVEAFKQLRPNTKLVPKAVFVNKDRMLYNWGDCGSALAFTGLICDQFREQIFVDVDRLDKILEENSFPSQADYFSLDIEKCEEHVLAGFPFDEYKFNVITVEVSMDRLENIKRLVCNGGYICVGYNPPDLYFVNNEFKN